MAGLPSFVCGTWTRALRRRGRCLPWLAVLALASGCHPFRVSLWFGGPSKIKVEAIAAHMNHDTPVAVEVLFIYDKATLDQLLAMDAKTWFAGRDQFIRDHAGKVETSAQVTVPEVTQATAFDSWKWEWVPGQDLTTIPAMTLEYKMGALGGVIFATYSTPGSHRQRIDPQQDIHLALGDTDFTAKQGS